MSVVRKIQTGTLTLVGTATDVSVSTYSTSQAILFFMCEGGNINANRSLTRGEKVSTTSIGFRRNTTGTQNPFIRWWLFEFDGDTDVQDIQLSGTEFTNAAISSVNLADSFVMIGGITNAATAPTDTCSYRAVLISSVLVGTDTGSFGTTATMNFQVIEQGGVHGIESVQSFERDDSATTWNQTISSVDTSRTWLLGGGDPLTDFHEYDDIYTLELTSSTNVQGAHSSAVSWNSGCHIVEYKSDVSVQSGSVSIGSDTDVTLTSLKIVNAVPQLSSASGMCFSNGTNSTSTNNAASNQVIGIIDSTTNLNLHRHLTTGTLTGKWFVLEYDQEVISEATLDDTPQTNTGTDGDTFNHTIGSGDNRVLIVCVATRGTTTSNTLVDSTFNSVAMTEAITVASAGSGTNVRSTIFYMLESSLPVAGSYEVDVTTPSGTADETIVTVFSYSDVTQAAPDTAFAGSESSISDIQTDITTTGVDGIAIDCFAGGNGAQSTESQTGQIERGDASTANMELAVSTRETGLAEDWPMSWEFGGSFARHAHTIIAFDGAPPVTTIDIAGESDGVATVAGTLDIIAIDIDGESDGVATVAGALDVTTELEGESDGVATAVSNLIIIDTISGESDGVATVAGSLGILTELVGNTDGVATVIGTLQSPLVGQSDGVATVAGTIDVLTGLEVQPAGVAVVSATMNQTHRPLGLADGVATVTADLDVIGNVVFIEAQSDGTSVVQGDGTLLEILTQLQVGISGQASVIATLAPDRILEASSDGVATVAGTIDVLTQVVGEADGQASVLGNLGVLTQLAGQSAGVNATLGNLAGKIAVLIGQSDGVASVTGTLQVATSLASAVAGVATAQGSIITQLALDGLSAGLADVQATLNKIREVEGESDGVATALGTLGVLTAVEAVVEAAATVAGTVDVQTVLQVAVAGVAEVQGQLEIDTPIDGQSDGVAIVQGVLDVLTALEANSAGIAIVQDAALVIITGLVGQSDGVATVTADMLSIAEVAGQSDGVASVSANLLVETILRALSEGESIPVGALNVFTPLTGESLGFATVQGRLSVPGQPEIVGSTRGRARVSGALTVISFNSNHAQKTNPNILTRTL